jgi:putative endonuclease
MMHVFSNLVFSAVNLAARRGFAPELDAPPDSTSAATAKLRARQRGVYGETYAYWYLRRHGYVMIARNFTVAGIKGELDLVGYDGDVLAFIEVKLRSMDAPMQAAGTDPAAARLAPRVLPEDAVGPAKRRDLIRMARHFLAHWRKHKGPFRFDILAIEARTGAAPIVRLHKDAFAMRI